MLQELYEKFDNFTRSVTDEDDFTERAADFLKQFNFSKGKVEKLKEEVLSQPTENFPNQYYAYEQFGAPAFTLKVSDDIFLELYFWASSKIPIHSHHFDGAFKILGEKCSHIKFEFSEDRRLSDNIIWGDLSIVEKEVVKRNDICKIKKDDDFIHSIKHIEGKGLSLIVRKIYPQDYLSIFYFPNLKIKFLPMRNIILKKKYFVLNSGMSNIKFKTFFESLSEEEVYLLFVNQYIPDRNYDEFIKLTKKKYKNFEIIFDNFQQTDSLLKNLHGVLGH